MVVDDIHKLTPTLRIWIVVNYRYINQLIKTPVQLKQNDSNYRGRNSLSLGQDGEPESLRCLPEAYASGCFVEKGQIDLVGLFSAEASRAINVSHNFCRLRLYLRIHQIAHIPSFQPIFLPSL